MQKVVLATGNAGKVRELSGALVDFGIEIVAKSALGVASVQETGLTFIENALVKARHAARVTGLPVIADDSGLALNALAGGPGIYSARYASEEASDRENLDKLLVALATVPHGQRGAQFHCVLVYLRHTNDPTPLVCHGSWSGEIACQSSGTGAGSFGYDPVFLLTEQGCTAADLTAQEKQAISHRAQALLSLYLHIPWCVQKCPYCDFNSHELHGEVPHQDYVDHLLADLDHDISLTSGRTVDTLFIGGGTPSLLSSSAMRSLLDGVRQRLPLLPNAEITMEANPGTIEVDRFAAYQLGGINRISIGVQSFEPEKLARLGRIHGAEEARRAARLAASLGLCSFNLDLMNGLPDQSLAGALDDLTQAIALKPPHLSWYQLTIEPNTLFGSRPPVLPNDDALWDIYQHGDRLLTAAGYRQYETSTYAFPGFQCHHNLNYWRFGDYLGIGCGAHGKLTQFDGTILRTVKTRNPRGYMQGNYLAKRYQVAPTELPFEYFMNRFRLLEASPRVEFTAFTGLTESTVRYALDRALAGGYISESDSHWQVTDHGKLFLNSLLEIFI